MFFKITLLIIILVLFYLLLDYSIKTEHFTDLPKYTYKKNVIQNFIAYPNNQPYCASIFNSKAKYWSKLPNNLCKGLYLKYCSTGCYYKICKFISCSNNKNGLYKVCKLNSKDIDNLKKYYNEKNIKNKFDFSFNDKILNSLKGKHVLKLKYKKMYYPIQLLKYKKDMNRYDIVIDKVLNKKYKCKKKNTLKLPKILL